MSIEQAVDAAAKDVAKFIRNPANARYIDAAGFPMWLSLIIMHQIRGDQKTGATQAGVSK